eukprot:scaffold2092_cov137-Isochrysis_galbana.AAC.3
MSASGTNSFIGTKTPRFKQRANLLGKGGRTVRGVLVLVRLWWEATIIKVQRRRICRADRNGVVLPVGRHDDHRRRPRWERGHVCTKEVGHRRLAAQ